MESLAATITSQGNSISATILRSAPPMTDFLVLFKTWTLNPVASLSLSLLCEAYQLCELIVNHISEIQVTVGLLMQVDKLVQLFESPIFLVTRMHLLEPSRPDSSSLLRTLYGLLMILPQGTAFTTLKERLGGVVSLHNGGRRDQSGVVSLHNGGRRDGDFINIEKTSIQQNKIHIKSGKSSTTAFNVDTQFAIYVDRQRAIKKVWSQSLKTRSLINTKKEE
jgi:hypothetical protein